MPSPPPDADAAEVVPAPPRRLRPLWREALGLILLALVLSLLVKTYVVQAFSIPSGSMERTLHGCPGCHDDDRVLVDKIGYRFSDPSRGDVVVFAARGTWAGPDAPKDYVKRVVGVPGDVVACCDAHGRVVIDGTAVDEPYLFEDDEQTFGPVTVPAGRLWVMGDHRSVSADSRVHGFVRRDAVVGRAVLTVWPPWRLHLLHGG